MAAFYKKYTLLFLLIALIGTSCGQPSTSSSSKDNSFTKTIDTKHNPFPAKPQGWVSDYEYIFTTEQINELDSMISRFEKETTNEICIVTIDISWATQENFDSLTLAIAKKWAVGKKDKNNGILFGISAGLKTMRIQNGLGIEAKMADAETKHIVDNIIVPAYKDGNYFEGTKQGLLAIMEQIR